MKQRILLGQLAESTHIRYGPRAGITPEAIAEKLREGMESTEVKLATWEGKFTDGS